MWGLAGGGEKQGREMFKKGREKAAWTNGNVAEDSLGGQASTRKVEWFRDAEGR